MKKNKKDPKRTEAIKYAFWNKWAGTKPATVIRTKGITNDPWTVHENVTNVTPSELDSTLTKGV